MTDRSSEGRGGTIGNVEPIGMNRRRAIRAVRNGCDPGSGVPPRWRLPLLAALIVLAFTPSAGQADSPDDLSTATALANFVRLTEWPGSAFESADAPVVLCVLDLSAVSDALQAIEGKVVRGRRLAVRSWTAAGNSECHILFANGPDSPRRRSAVRAAHGRPILVVGAETDFALKTGMIGLVTDESRIVFEINPLRIEAAGLKISSRLLKIGRIVSCGGAE